MAQLQQVQQQACSSILKGIHGEIILSNYRIANNDNFNIITRKEKDISDQRRVKISGLIMNKQRCRGRGRLLLQVHCTSTTSSTTSTSTSGDHGDAHETGRILLSENGWKVRRMIESEEEMRMVAKVQAEAFYEPVVFFNNFFFESFKAEVLSGLLYRLRNSPPNRYACLVAEPTMNNGIQQLVGAVDITVQRDNDTLQYLQEAEEYLYVSGIAVSTQFRRQKVATALLGACEKLSNQWGFDYLALRAYEDDTGACTLYKNSGFVVAGKDSEWMTTWIGRRRRLLMIKRSNNKNNLLACQTQQDQ